MTVAITGSAMRTCLGDEGATYAALLSGRSGVGPLFMGDPEKLNVRNGYPIRDGDGQRRASRWLTDVVGRAVVDAALPPSARVAAVIGTGLRELRSLERWHGDGAELRLSDLHFAAAVRAALPGVTEVHTVTNACAASGYALALGADLLDLDEADAVVVAGCDSMTESMIAMIGRISPEQTARVRPFDVDRTGVLLGEGASAVVIEPDRGQDALGRVLGVGLTCDARHETAPDRDGIVAAMRDAHTRAGVTPGDIDLVIAHGTATALNDPIEASALIEVFGPHGPRVTGIKGAIGHTSGGAALMSLQVALSAMREWAVPPTVGLRRPIPEAKPLRLVYRDLMPAQLRITQVNSFGFGGVNAVAIVSGARNGG